MADAYGKHNGDWKPVVEALKKIDGEWQPVTPNVKHGGEWQSVEFDDGGSEIVAIIDGGTHTGVDMLSVVEDQYGSSLPEEAEVRLVLESGTVIQAPDTIGAALSVEGFDETHTVILENHGTIQGAGARGGTGGYWDTDGNAQLPEGGKDGGDALRVRSEMSLDNQGSIIAGAGSGEGGAAYETPGDDGVSIDRWDGGGGGGGAGRPAGAAGTDGEDHPDSNDASFTDESGTAGTASIGGDGGSQATDGGDAGEDAEAGGSSGFAIDGSQNVTYINQGDIRGET